MLCKLCGTVYEAASMKLTGPNKVKLLGGPSVICGTSRLPLSAEPREELLIMSGISVKVSCMTDSESAKICVCLKICRFVGSGLVFWPEHPLPDTCTYILSTTTSSKPSECQLLLFVSEFLICYCLPVPFQSSRSCCLHLMSDCRGGIKGPRLNHTTDSYVIFQAQTAHLLQYLSNLPSTFSGMVK